MFIINNDSSKAHIGVEMSQYGKPIGFYSFKLTPAQIIYTNTERELFSILETLKKFLTIISGQRITVYTDHNNLTF